MDLVTETDRTKSAPAVRGLGTPRPQASALRRRVGAGHPPITVADPNPNGGSLNVLVLMDRAGSVRDVVEAIVDRLGPQLGNLVLCAPVGGGVRLGRVAMTLEQLRVLAEGTPFGARVAFGRRDETVALEACEGRFRLVVDLTEDAGLRRTLMMCAIAYVVGPQGVVRFAEEVNRRPRLLTPPRDADRSDRFRSTI